MRAWVAVGLVAVLAGCSEGAMEGSGADEPPGVITDPRAVEQSGTGQHVHDYWGGADQLQVLDGRRGSTWNNGGGEFDWRVYFTPSDGNVVPQGTARLTVTVDWADDLPANRYADVSLWVKPADVATPRFVQLVTRGSTVEIPLQYAEADLPHQLISAWEFAIQYNSTGGPNLFIGSTDLNVVAHRGLELQPFPAHPDRWMGQASLPLLDQSGTFTNVGYTGSGSIAQRFRPANGTVVPYDAGFVDVTLETGNRLPAGGLQLSYHAADSRDFTAIQPETTQGGLLQYSIAVEPGMGDGPYGNASLWEFRLYTPATAPGNDPAVYDGPYRLTAVVVKR